MFAKIGVARTHHELDCMKEGREGAIRAGEHLVEKGAGSLCGGEKKKPKFGWGGQRRIVARHVWGEVRHWSTVALMEKRVDR